MDVLNLKKLNDRKLNDRIQDESRFANDLQRDFPSITRTEALQIAREVLSRRKQK